MTRFPLKIFFSLLLLPALSVQAQNTTKFTADKSNEYGLVYNLPVTALQVTVAVEKTVKTPGEFYPYAKKLLNANPITSPSTSYKPVEVVINPIAVADPEEQYLVTYKAGQPVTMMLSKQNFPLSINDDTYRPTSEVLPVPNSVKPEPTILETPVALQAATEEMVQSKSSIKKAELAAARILELRENRRDITTGNADNMPSDGTALALALKTIDEQEAALTAMFLGTTQTSIEVKTYNVEIKKNGTLASNILCRLSQTRGLVPADDLGGAPIYINLKEISRSEMPVNEKGEEKTFPKGGVAYRIPGEADVTVSYDNEELASRRLSVTQLGVVFGLDPALFSDKKIERYQHFNPLDGSLKEQGILE